PRAYSGLQDGIGLDERANSRALFESDLLRTRRLWCRLGRTNVFWERPLLPDDRRIGISGWSPEIAEPLLAFQGLRSREKATGTCAGAYGGGEIHHSDRTRTGCSRDAQFPSPWC